MRTILFAAVAAAALVAGPSLPAVAADTVTVTDVAGRTVEVPKDPTRIVLGESRMIYAISVIDRENPFARVVGWKDDLENFDPDAYRKFLAKFPEIADIALLGSPTDAEYSLEKLIALDAQGGRLIVVDGDWSAGPVWTDRAKRWRSARPAE